MVDLKKLKKLREKTDVSYAICLKALKESNGDLHKAEEFLLKQGAHRVAKKINRQTNQGAIFSYLHHNKKIASLIELLCETDFVARNKTFNELGEGLAMQVASLNPTNLEELLGQDYIKDTSKTIKTLIKEAILKLGENIRIGKFVCWKI